MNKLYNLRRISKSNTILCIHSVSSPLIRNSNYQMFNKINITSFTTFVNPNLSTNSSNSSNSACNSTSNSTHDSTIMESDISNIPNIITIPNIPETKESLSLNIESNIINDLNKGYKFKKRTHNCGELNISNLGERVILNGWTQRLRELSSNLYFLPIRDSFGITQLTGEIEVEIDRIHCLNPANKLPFFPSDKQVPNEEVRLKYRYLDLRREQLQNNIRKRSLVSWIIRDFLMKEEFIEVETPMLFKSTPEGAREFIVPTRSKGLFYALTQSPQQYKQLLMAGGIDKYFQIVKCFRDEDTRSDRQPEFTQIDLEMSFVTISDITSLIEKLIMEIWKKALGIDLQDKIPFPRISYLDAINKFGSDKPDTRYNFEIKDLSKYFNHILPELNSDTIIECILIKNGIKSLTNSEINSLKDLDNNDNNNSSIKRESLISKPIFIKITSTNISNWISKIFINKQSNDSQIDDETITKELGIDVGDLVIINKRKTVVLVRGQHYDLLLNGVEVGGGSIRIHSPILQNFIFHNILKMNEKQKSGFSHLLNAFSHGCPPHGGIALGFDRLMSIICNASSIRDVMAFPKSSSGCDLSVSSPGEITKEQLMLYKIDVEGKEIKRRMEENTGIDMVVLFVSIGSVSAQSAPAETTVASDVPTAAPPSDTPTATQPSDTATAEPLPTSEEPISTTAVPLPTSEEPIPTPSTSSAAESLPPESSVEPPPTDTPSSTPTVAPTTTQLPPSQSTPQTSADDSTTNRPVLTSATSPADTSSLPLENTPPPSSDITENTEIENTETETENTGIVTTKVTTKNTSTENDTTPTSTKSTPKTNEPEPDTTIPTETTTTGKVSCSSCKIDSTVNTSIKGRITTSTEDVPQSESGTITTFSPTNHATTNVKYKTTTFYSTTTLFYPGYTTTYTTTINGKAIPTESYVPPSTVVVVKKVTAAVPEGVSEPTGITSNAGGSNNLNLWKDKLNRLVICLWAIGVGFVYVILA
ncbi:9266_t:CDS:10 [Diversispora eburnea]|uniref:9266_t:CDS:1 n=1 Tax=Diversispora eburnea TaxID=1213867 RepID=A0A9N8YSP7_9GLOM|nr:9266_t:CDS:10 [Diversispora eburnea]